MTDEEQIQEMIKTLDSTEPTPEPEVKAEPAPETKEPEKEEPKVEEVKEEPKVEEPKVEEPKEPEKKEEPKPVEPDPKDKEIETLRSRVAELETTKKEPPKEEPKPEIKDQDFIGDIDLDDLTRDPKKLNEFANKLYRQARTDTEKELALQLPTLISKQVEVINTLREAKDNFFAQNEDLKKFPKVVQTVFGELVEKTPDKTLDELLTDVEKEVRTRLDLPRKTVEKEETPPKEVKKDKVPPKLPSRSGAPNQRIQEVPRKGSLEDDIEAMNKAVKL